MENDLLQFIRELRCPEFLNLIGVSIVQLKNSVPNECLLEEPSSNILAGS